MTATYSAEPKPGRKSSPHSARNRQRWACQKCGLVGTDVRRYAVSDCLTTVELRLCVDCRRSLRADPIVIVEEQAP